MASPPHLVQVHHDVRRVLEQQPDLPLGFRLALDEHVPVQVEQVVVAPSARPRLVVLGRHAVRIGPAGPTLRGGRDEARPAVGILDRIDQHQRSREDAVHRRVAAGREQVVRLRHGRAARADLVAVHPVHERGHDRQVTDELLSLVLRQPTRMGEPRQPGLHLVEAPDPVRGPDHERHQRAALPALRVADQAGPVGRGLGERLEVADDLVRRRDLRAHLVPGHPLDGRHRGVVPRSGGQLLRGRGPRGEEGERQREAEGGERRTAARETHDADCPRWGRGIRRQVVAAFTRSRPSCALEATSVPSRL